MGTEFVNLQPHENSFGELGKCSETSVAQEVFLSSGDILALNSLRPCDAYMRQ